jgi:hypothetical protein
VRAAPAVSCAKCAKGNAHEHTGSAETLRPSLRSGFTAYFVLSPVNGSFATVIGRSLASTDLTPAPRRQDHTTSPYASCAFVLRAFRVHRISPHVRDDRDPPLVCRETRGFKSLICPTRRAQYFCAKGWTDFWWVICPSGKITPAFKTFLSFCIHRNIRLGQSASDPILPRQPPRENCS